MNPSQIFTVSELTRSIRSFLENEIGEIWVTGEVCNYRRQASGHQYFTLKDSKSQLGCVLFFRPAMELRQIPLTDGMQVQIRGDMTVYEARGQYQLNVNLVQAAGVGLLQAKFEALKKKLEAEGLFDSQRKRSLPKFPASIGIVTSPTGAAIRDMLNILQRRAPWIEIIINPVRVQGKGAAEEISTAIDEFNDFASNQLPKVDIIVVCRGGGSADDLWEFNEEIVARSIYNSAIPVVSAVGHEIDFTIADFVADLRAPTPSAAAELIAPDAIDLARRFAQIEQRLHREVLDWCEQCKARLAFITRGILFREPRKQIAETSQQIDYLEEQLHRVARLHLGEQMQHISSLLATIRQYRPDQLARMKRQELGIISVQLTEKVKQHLQIARNRLNQVDTIIRILAPRATLERGYSITVNMSGEIVRSVAQIQPQMEITTHLHDGSLISIVK